MARVHAYCNGVDAVGAQAYHGGSASLSVSAYGGGPGARPVAAGYADPEPEPAVHTTCSGTTKAGNLCGAPKVHGEELCVGHLRSVKADG